MQQALDHADRIILLDEGRKVVDAPASTLSAQDLIMRFGARVIAAGSQSAAGAHASWHPGASYRSASLWFAGCALLCLLFANLAVSALNPWIELRRLDPASSRRISPVWMLGASFTR